MIVLVLSLLVGAHVSWNDRVTGEIFCGRLTLIQENRVWIVPDISPYWYAVEPVTNVTVGCPK